MGKSVDRKSGSAGMPRPISYAVFCLKKKMVAIGRERSIHPIIERTGRFGVNILGEYSQALSACCAGAPSPLPLEAFCNAKYFFFNDTATTEIYTLSLHDALPI